jgi:hypothetical protein
MTMSKSNGKPDKVVDSHVYDFINGDGLREQRTVRLIATELSGTSSGVRLTISRELNAELAQAFDRGEVIVVQDESCGSGFRKERVEVPAAGELLLSYVTSPESLEAMLGDLEERFRKIASRHGLPAARLWYSWEVARSVVNFIGRAAVLWELLRKLRI